MNDLSLRQWYWCVQAWWRLLVYRVQLGVRSMRWFEANLDKDSMSEARQAGVSNMDMQRAHEMYESVRLAGRCQPFATECLLRSLVLRDMLLRRDIPAQIKIGVNKVDKRFASHAWVQIGTEIIGESSESIADFKALKTDV